MISVCSRLDWKTSVGTGRRGHDVDYNHIVLLLLWPVESDQAHEDVVISILVYRLAIPIIQRSTIGGRLPITNSTSDRE